MKKITQLNVGVATAVMGLALISAPAYAQEEVQETTTSDEVSTASDAIIVTGSRIRRPDLESTVPVASVSGDSMFEQANVNVGEALNNMPQLRSTFAQQNPGLSIGIAGLNLLDLRGLGVARTLVLVDGRRHIASDLQGGAASVDVNTIPSDMIERVDIVTGGNSAVYGSDAIAGVVNFIMKKDFDGIQVRGGVGIPEIGAGGNRYLAAIVGKNFAGGRGNVMLAGEYSRQDRIFGSQIPWLRQNNGFATMDTDASGSDGIPDTVFTRNIRSSTISRFGLIPIVQTRNTAAPCGTGIPSGAGTRTNYNCNYVFDAAGNLSPQTGARTSTGPTGQFIGGNGDNNREDQLLSVMPFNERYVVNLVGRYELSDAAEFFVDAKYARAHTRGSNSGPAFNQGYNTTFADYRANYRLDNPFLTAAQRTLIGDAILASGSNTGLSGGSALTAANRAAIADGTYRFTLARNLTDLGIRDEDALRQTFRIVAGLRGDFAENWGYEVSANYGKAKERINILGNVNIQRLMLAFDAGIDPNNPGAGIQCRSKFDPASAGMVADVAGDNAAAALAADIAACVPYNPFGGKDNRAARDYIVTDSGSAGQLTQWDVTAFVSGDTSSWFNLPGGPVGVVLGGEWRREDAYFKADDIVNSGMTFMNALQTFDPPALEVLEGFGELRVPILKDRPFFYDLNLSGAARVSKYNKAYGSTGTVWAWNVGGEWAPIRDIRFRANYGRSVRAPNYTDTASPLSQSYAPGFQDPCNANRIGNGTEYRKANCTAALGDILNDPDYQQATSLNTSPEIRSGSNANLTEETSKSLTIGAVIQPRFFPGFALTVDYYDIKVKSVISSPSAQLIVNSCYDLPDMDNQFCALFERAGANGGPVGEAPGELLEGSLVQSPLNFAKRERRGIDFQATYARPISDNVSLSARIYYTHQFKNSDYMDPTQPNFENRLLSELGDPEDEFVFNIDATFNEKFKIGYGAHYIGPMLTTTYENLYSLQGRPAQNQDVVDIWKYPSVLYHNARVSFLIGAGADKGEGLEWFAGVDNFTNKKPPLGSTATGAGSAIYEVMGRKFFTGFRARF